MYERLWRGAIGVLRLIEEGDVMRKEYTVSKELEQPAAAVWAVLREFAEIDWVDGFLRCEPIGEGIGMIRRIYVSEDFFIDERLTEFSDESMRLAYDFPDEFPFPLKDYKASVRVSDDGASRCTIVWCASGIPDGVTDAQAEETVTGLYDGLYNNLCRHLGQV